MLTKGSAWGSSEEWGCHPKEILSPEAVVVGCRAGHGETTVTRGFQVFSAGGPEHTEAHRDVHIEARVSAGFAGQQPGFPHPLPWLSGAVCGPGGLQAGGNRQAY